MSGLGARITMYYNGYCDALLKHGIKVDPSLVFQCDNRSDAERIAPEVLDRDDRPDAFFAVNDEGLIGRCAQTVVQRIGGGRRTVPHPDVVVVHGAGLINGKVGPLLGSRITGGIDAWRDEDALRPGVPLLVMSGGQGPDEPVSEARAMADYAIARGIPAERILLEDRSTTTRQNIAYTRDLLAEHGMADPQVLLVTSSSHAVRTAILASDMGVPWAVASAPPARCRWTTSSVTTMPATSWPSRPT